MVVQEYHKPYVSFMKQELFRDKRNFAVTLWDLEFIMKDILRYNNMLSYENTPNTMYSLIQDTFIDKYLDTVGYSENSWLIKKSCVAQGRLAFRLLPNQQNWVNYQTKAQCLDLLIRCIVYDFNNSMEMRKILSNLGRVVSY